MTAHPVLKLRRAIRRFVCTGIEAHPKIGNLPPNVRRLAVSSKKAPARYAHTSVISRSVTIKGGDYLILLAGGGQMTELGVDMAPLSKLPKGDRFSYNLVENVGLEDWLTLCFQN